MGKTTNHICVYDNCLKSQRDTVGISFFKFPIKDLKRTKRWQKNCGNKHVATMDVHNLKNLLICEDHFLPMYILVNNRRKLLSKVAVPIKCYDGESSDGSDNETSNDTRLHTSNRNDLNHSRTIQNTVSSRSSSKLDETNNDKLKVNVTNLKTYKARPKSAATKKSTETNEIPLQQTADVRKHEDDSLYHFFMSGYHATRVLPKHVQCKIKNKISGIIFEEEKKVFETNATGSATSSLSCDNFIPFVQKIEKDDAIELN